MNTHSLPDVLSMEIPEREDLISGMVPRGDAVLLSAREKAGKGLLTMCACRCVAAGEPFLGREVMQGPSLYLALEEGPRTIRDRLREFAGDRPALPMHIAFLDGSEGQTFRLDDHASIVGLRDKIVELKAVLVVLDVLREAHDGRENESDDMAILLRPIRQLAHELNTTIIVTHHASRAGGFRGSTSIAASFDDVLEFARDDLASDSEIRGLLTGRGRDLPKFSQHIEFDAESFRWRPIHGAPLVSQPTNIREKIIDALNSTDDWLTADEIHERVPGAKLKTIQNALAGIVKERYRPLLVQGTGKRGDPQRYHGIHKRRDIGPDTPGIDPGTKGTLGNGQCVECDTRVGEGQVHCPAHAALANGSAPISANPVWGEHWDMPGVPARDAV